MENQSLKEKQERILLKKEDALKLDHWIAIAEEKTPGLKLSRSQVIQWLISTKEELISSTDIQSLKDKYFDELTHMKWIVKEMAKAVERGEKPSLSQFISQSPKRKPRKDLECKEPKT